MAELTKTMQKAVEFARQHGGTLRRHPGGFWAGPKFNRNQGGQYFGTSTVAGLVSRGVAEYTEWRDGRNFKFPVEVTLSEGMLF